MKFFVLEKRNKIIIIKIQNIGQIINIKIKKNIFVNIVIKNEVLL